VAEWRSRQHLEDHFGLHRGELGVRSVAEYDASAQDTITVGVRFTYRDRGTGEPRIGYFDRESARFTSTDLQNFIVTHFQTDEGYAADVPRSTYHD
jgi:hypothetical protein